MLSFSEQVYELVRSIPAGEVLTYGEVAFLAGRPRASRIVGQILHRNPSPSTTPCHRIVFKDGSLASAFAFGGEGVQRALLEAEGVRFGEDGRVIFSKHLTTP